MKNILLTYNDIKSVNIGDYVQSLAAKQFLKDKDFILFNRDELNLYTGEKAKLILNAWFTYKPKNFPPSPDIKPLFVAFHLNSKVKNEILAKEKNIEYLRKYAPIGCRDIATKEALEEKGVTAYFSGCLTTTLGLTYRKNESERGEIIYVVDPFSYMPKGNSVFEILKTFTQFLLNFKGVVKIIRNNKRNNKFSLGLTKMGVGRVLLLTKTYLLLKSILSDELLDKVVFITQFNTRKEYVSDEARFERAEELLNMYSVAKYVITSRIHCALPCLALKTPVLFIDHIGDKEESTCRLDGIRNLFQTISVYKGRVRENKYGLLDKDTIIVNDYSKLNILQEKLIATCEKFMGDE